MRSVHCRMPRRKQLHPIERIWGSESGPFEGNDIRQRGGHVARCILCGSRTILRLSHVIPKWAFRWHKDAWNGAVLTHLLSRGVVTKQQDGNKHYLMCERCEQHASVTEAYALSVVERDRKALRRPGTRFLFRDWFWHLRMDLIAQFISITALRCHYAESVPFQTTTIPTGVRRALRGIAWHGSTCEGHSVLAWRFVPPTDSPDHDPRQDIDAMYEDAQVGKLFIILVGGIEWCLSIGRDSNAEALRRIALRGRGFERITSISFSEYRRFKHPEKWLQGLAEKMEANKPLHPTAGNAPV